MWRKYALYELVYFWGLAGTLQAILTPDLPYRFPDLMYTVYYINHGLIVGIFYTTIVFRLRPTLRSVGRIYLLTLAYTFLFVAPLNMVLDTNFLYLRQKPAGASMLDFLGPWPWYIASASIVALVSYLFYYSPFWIRDLVADRGEKSEPVPT